MVEGHHTEAVELSALRDHEVGPLVRALQNLDLGNFKYVSVHAPSSFKSLPEAAVAELLEPCSRMKIPLVIHPDSIRDPSCWKSFGSLLCIENMDKRKVTGRTVRELERFFTMFPDATFCLDLAHARQVDSTMGEARQMLRRFEGQLRQIHVSEIDAAGHHDRLSFASILAAQNVASLIPAEVPAIIEAMISPVDIDREVAAVQRALAVPKAV